MIKRIKKGDEVIVTTGKDKGRQGTVTQVLGDRVKVEGINLRKKHLKANPQVGQVAKIDEIEASIHVSNVMLFNPASGKGERVGTKVLEDGRRVRVFRSSGEVI